MNNTKSKLMKCCLLLVGSLFASCAIAASVGTVIFKSGDASITRADKTVIQAEKNTPLNEGDTIETRDGRIQFSLIDGGKISLQPNSVFKINKYQFSGKEDGSEFAITELIKGGLRTITGLIGHKNRERYQLKTAVATIGIRGTEFTLNFNDNQLLMTTNHGSVDVCGTTGNCLNAITGQSIAVNGIGANPKFSSEAAKAASAPPASNKPTFAVADAISDGGLPAVVADVAPTPSTPAGPSLANYNGSAIVGTLMKTYCSCGIDDVYEASIQTDAGSQPTSMSNANGLLINLNNLPANKLDQTSDGIISIGTVWRTSSSATVGSITQNAGATGNSIEWLNYMIGEKPLASQLTNLSGTYNVFASTAPIQVDSAGNSSIVGTAGSITGWLQFNFNTGNYTFNLNVPTTVATFTLNGGGSALDINDPHFHGGGAVSSNNSTCASFTCTPAVDGTYLVQGAFVGQNGERASMQYGFYVPSASIWGSTALK